MTDRHDVERVVGEAYVFLFPLLLMDVTRRLTISMPAGARPGFGPANAFTHLEAFPPGDFRDVVRPNYDTLYSVAWLDLTDGPVVVSAPDTAGRYYMLPLLDMWTDVFAVVGSRTTGTGEGDHCVVPPGWHGEVPAGTTRIESPTSWAWIIGRTQTNGPADYDAVHAVQRGFRATPASRWPGDPAPRSAEPEESADPTIAPLDQIAAMTGIDYFTYGFELMARHGCHLIDQPIVARMRRIGLEAGSPLVAEALDSDVRRAIDAVPGAALAQMRAAVPNLNPVVNGWSMARGNIGVYGTNYLFRAVIAMIGLGANLAEDAIYPVLLVDDAGRPPSGDRRSVLHFDADGLPPVDAFWSVTMYDAEGFPVPNALERYALGDRDPLQYNADGSLDLYLGHEHPGEDLEANWLPAPAGPIGVTLRLYGPRPEALDGRWSPPPLRDLS